MKLSFSWEDGFETWDLVKKVYGSGRERFMVLWDGGVGTLHSNVLGWYYMEGPRTPASLDANERRELAGEVLKAYHYTTESYLWTPGGSVLPKNNKHK